MAGFNNAGAMAMIAAVVITFPVVGCGGVEDWGGPKGPPIPTATTRTTSAAVPVAATPKSGSQPGGSPDTGSGTKTPAPSGVSGPILDGPAKSGVTESANANATGAPPVAPATTGSAGAGATPQLKTLVTSEVHGGKIAGLDEAVATVRPAVKACADGKAQPDAQVEVLAKVGPKGEVTGTDVTGGSQFGDGVVACVVKAIEGAKFKKPTAGTPKVLFRVRARAVD